jgi:hypothetical protein
MRDAMTLRSRDIFSVVPRRGEASAAGVPCAAAAPLGWLLAAGC